MPEQPQTSLATAFSACQASPLSPTAMLVPSNRRNSGMLHTSEPRFRPLYSTCSKGGVSGGELKGWDFRVRQTESQVRRSVRMKQYRSEHANRLMIGRPIPSSSFTSCHLPFLYHDSYHTSPRLGGNAEKECADSQTVRCLKIDRSA